MILKLFKTKTKMVFMIPPGQKLEKQNSFQRKKCVTLFYAMRKLDA